MEVRLADCAGFCFGVKRAVDTVYEQLKNGKTIYTYGPIVHNEEVVRELSEKGVRVLENKEDLKQLKAGENIPTVIIRAHGVAKEIYDIMEANGLECIDATCPFVKKIHRIVELKSNEGYHVIVVGDPKHPEVEGIVGWCPGPVTVLETPDQAENFVKTEGEKLCIVSQTTYNYNKFQYIVEIFEKKGEEYFRNLETELVRKISAMDNIVVSCGGGTVMRQCNVDEMKKNGTIVLLTAEPETVYERVKGSHNRPLLEKNMNPEYIKELMEARRPKYEAAADFVIKTDNRTAEEICLEINKRLKIDDN